MRSRRILQGAFLALGFILVGTSTLPSQSAGFDHTHAAFAEVLSRFVHDGWVDYTDLKKDRKGLDRYLDDLAAVPKKDFGAWSQQEQIAFLVNLYNAATLELIIDHRRRSCQAIRTNLSRPKPDLAGRAEVDGSPIAKSC